MAAKNQTKIVAEPGKQEVFIIREFEAPRDLVFQAFTDPKLVTRWLGPRNLKTKVDIWEPGDGGRWRLIHTAQDGHEFAFHGVCHESTPPERIIRTFEFEGLPERGHVVLETAIFEKMPGDRTKVTIQSVFRSLQDRDGMMMSGMEKGVFESHEKLDELFERELQVK